MLAPALEQVGGAARAGGAGREDVFPFDPAGPAPRPCRAPTSGPMAAPMSTMSSWCAARGAEMPREFWTDPLMYQGGSDGFLGPCDPIRVADEALGIDLEAEVAVITDDVPMGVAPRAATAHQAGDAGQRRRRLRNLIPAELAKGFGFFQGKPPSAFSPVAVTPGRARQAWRDGKLHRRAFVRSTARSFGHPDAGVDMTFDFAAADRARGEDAPARRRHDRRLGHDLERSDRGQASAGSSCLAERRMLETIGTAAATTPFLKFGDRVRIEMLDAAAAPSSAHRPAGRPLPVPAVAPLGHSPYNQRGRDTDDKASRPRAIWPRRGDLRRAGAAACSPHGRGRPQYGIVVGDDASW